MFVIVQNSYFDENDFSNNPIKKLIKQYQFATTYNESTVYYGLLSRNEVSLQDSLLWGQPKNKSFVESRVDYVVN